MHLTLHTKKYMLVFLCPQTVTHQWFIQFIACSISTMHCVLSKGDFVQFFCTSFLSDLRGSRKIAAMIRSFVVEKLLISNGTLRTNCTYAKWTNIYGHQKSNIFSNDASRCCFESSNGREGNCVLSRGFIIPSVRELLFFSCVIIIAKSCFMAAWYLYLFMDRWSPGIKVIIF